MRGMLGSRLARRLGTSALVHTTVLTTRTSKHKRPRGWLVVVLGQRTLGKGVRGIR